MTMSLFHNLKLKRRKVDSRSSSDGSEAAANDMIISTPSLASNSSEMTEDHRPNSRHSGFEVEVKPNKFELHAPKYTSWASPAKLKQEPMYTDDSPSLTATVVPKVFSNGSPTSTNSVATSSSSHHLPSDHRHSTSPATLVHTTNMRSTLPVNGPSHGHRLAEALRPPVTSSVVSMAAHLPLAAAAAAAKLQAMHPNLVSSSVTANHNAGSLHQPPLHHHHQPILRMVTPSNQFQPKLSPSKNNGEPLPQSPASTVSNAVKTSNVASAPSNSSPGRKPPGPSVILGEHGGVKTMIWTDSTTYWQTANKYRNLHVLPSQQQQQSPSLPPQPLQHQPRLQQQQQQHHHHHHQQQQQHQQQHSQVPLPLISRAVVSRSNDSTSILMPPVSSSTAAPTTTSVALKIERPSDHEQQLKMSSAVDGLLSLSSQGGVPPPRQPYPQAPPQMVQISPVHLSQIGGSNHPSPASTPARLSTSSVSSSPVPEYTSNSGLNLSPQFNQNPHQQSPTPRRRSPMNMERLWAGDMSQLPSHILESQNGHSNAILRPNLEPDDEEPLLCNICEDRATGLHYGIITCEG